jgi:hypothetical protein
VLDLDTRTSEVQSDASGLPPVCRRVGPRLAIALGLVQTNATRGADRDIVPDRRGGGPVLRELVRDRVSGLVVDVRFVLVAATVLASIARTPSHDRVVAARSRQMKVLLLPVILRFSSHGPADSARRMRESYYSRE